MDLRLKPGRHKVLTGFPWIYREELVEQSGWEQAAGEVVRVLDARGRFVGWGWFNPRSLITVRIVSRRFQEHIGPAWVEERVAQAVRLRLTRLAPGRDACRLINSEGDGLPGLVVDRYGEMLVMQILSLAMDRFRENVVAALVDLLHPAGILERGRDRVRAREGLPLEDHLRYGELVNPVWIREHGVRMQVDVAAGQKTGHFLDQYANRAAAAAYAANCRVADVFAHTAAFGLVALAAGAREVVAVEADAAALTTARSNAEANGWSDRLQTVQANAFDWLRAASDTNARYDMVVLDPPAFTRSKDAVEGALRGYKEINLRAMKLLPPGGVLVTASCSYHVSEADFIAVVADAAKDAKRSPRLLEIRGQSPDHVMSPFLPEARYLKCLILEMAD